MPGGGGGEHAGEATLAVTGSFLENHRRLQNDPSKCILDRITATLGCAIRRLLITAQEAANIFTKQFSKVYFSTNVNNKYFLGILWV